MTRWWVNSFFGWTIPLTHRPPLIPITVNLHCLVTDHGHFSLFSELLELVGFFSHFDESLFHIIQSLRERTQVNTSTDWKHIAINTHFLENKHTDLMEAIVDSQLVVIEQNLFLCGEEPLAEREAGARDSRCVVLHIQLMWKLIRGQLACWEIGRDRNVGVDKQ